MLAAVCRSAFKAVEQHCRNMCFSMGFLHIATKLNCCQTCEYMYDVRTIFPLRKCGVCKFQFCPNCTNFTQCIKCDVFICPECACFRNLGCVTCGGEGEWQGDILTKKAVCCQCIESIECYHCDHNMCYDHTYECRPHGVTVCKKCLDECNRTI